MSVQFAKSAPLTPLLAAIVFIALLNLLDTSANAAEISLASRQQSTALHTTSAVTIVVTTFEDEMTVNGACSLREAIQSVNTGNAVDSCAAPGPTHTVVALAAGRYDLTHAGANEDANQTGDLDLLATMDVVGRSRQNTYIGGAGLDRILHVHGGAVVTVRAVTLDDGRAPDGRVISQTAEPGEPGGAILNNGNLTLLESTVVASHAGNGASSPSNFFSSDRGGDGGAGGAISNDGFLRVERSTLSSNTAGSGGEGPCGGGGSGGAGGGIYNSGTLILTESTIEGNQSGHSGRGLCPPGAFGGTGGAGGGIANTGSALVEFSSILANATATGIDVFGTHTQGGHGGPGGGIANTGSLHLDNSTISGNRTGNGGSGAQGGNGGDGGGIYNAGSGTLAIDATTLAQNSAGTAGAELWEMGDGADGQGGGTANTATVQVRNTVMAGNVARQAPDCAGTLDSFDYNLIEVVDGCTLTGVLTHVLTNTAPLLGARADNGGPTLTHDPLSASPLRDSGACTTLLGYTMGRDQRGQPRPMATTCDRGAVEWGSHVYHWLPIIKFAE